MVDIELYSSEKLLILLETFQKKLINTLILLVLIRFNLNTSFHVKLKIETQNRQLIRTCQNIVNY